MLLTRYFLPVLKHDPAEAQIVSQTMATSANLGAAVGSASVPVGQVSSCLTGIAAGPAREPAAL